MAEAATAAEGSLEELEFDTMRSSSMSFSCSLSL
jgi:hypothetical protein